MADGGCGEPQLRDALGLYQLGALPDDEATAVERHLGTCAYCLADAERVGEAALLLALLSDADRADLAAEFGSPARRTARPDAGSPATGGAPAAGRVVDGDRMSPVGSRARDTRPAGSAGGPARPGPTRRRPRRRLLVGAGLAVVLFLGAVAVGGPVLAELLGGPAPTTLVADATDARTGATLAVSVTARDGGVGLRADVTGLTVGAPYRFYLTDIDGRSWELATFSGSDRPQVVTATCPVPVDRLARFSVTASDGSLAVMAAVQTRPSATPD